MKNKGKIMAFICFFALIAISTGAVSAANWTVNPGDSIQAVVDNASNNGTVLTTEEMQNIIGTSWFGLGSFTIGVPKTLNVKISAGYNGKKSTWMKFEISKKKQI